MEEILPALFNTERRKIISELRYLFNLEAEVAEDVVSDTFLSATRHWNDKALPQNPVAWLHTVARNNARNYLKKKSIFNKKLTPELKLAPASEEREDIEMDVARNSIEDSQLAMIFSICNPVIPNDAQIGLALNLLCDFSIQEIADAFFTNKHVIYKRLERAKERLKVSNIRIAQPTASEISERLDNVLTILYLMFSEGHFPMSRNNALRESLCTEAMHLNNMLIENRLTNTPAVNALFALMCFHASRFPARIKPDGTAIPYNEQDQDLWDNDLIAKGRHHLNVAATGKTASKFHIEAGIAYWHTQKEDTRQKWESILDLYNKLLCLDYSPVAALNRTYALARVKGKHLAIAEAEKLHLTDNLFYQSLLSFLSNNGDMIVNVI